MTTPAFSAEIARARALAPGVFAKPAAERIRLWAACGLFFALVVYCLWRMDFFDLPRIARGIGQIGFVLGFMLPPAHNGYLGEFAHGILETLAMAFLGTLGAAVLALPLGFLAAKNVVANRLIHFSLRRVFDGIRSVDALIWALIFINVVGLGPFAGILAIMVSDTGVFAKLFSEAVESVETKQVEGVRASGAARIHVVRLGMLPQVLPVMLSHVLYFFESNTRSATILGIVGAGGIGLQLSDRIRVNNWDEACFIILMILATVSLIDLGSREIRQRLIRARPAATTAV